MILINFESCGCYSRLKDHLNRPAYIEGRRFFFTLKGEISRTCARIVYETFKPLRLSRDLRLLVCLLMTA